MSYESEFKKLERRFVKEEKELIILTSEGVGGAGKFGDGMWTPSAGFLAFIDVSDNSFVREEGSVEWLCEDSESEDWRYGLKKLTAYRIKCRQETEKYRKGDVHRHIMLLTEVLERDVSDPRLQEVLDAYNTVVEIDDELCGKFVLNREFDWFEGEKDWCGREANIYLECDEDDNEKADDSLEYFKKVYADLENWDKKLRRFAAEKLTELANDWQDDSEDEEYEPITEEKFAERICIGEFCVYPNGEFTAYYDDDDMFFGHTVEIIGNIDGEIEDAYLCG